MAINWDETYSNGRDFRLMNQLLLRQILAKTGVDGGNVLDVGCGTGDLVVKLAERGYHVTGIDGSAVALDKARERAQASGVADRAEFRQLDLNNPAELGQLEHQRFDLIFCKLVLAFVTDQPALLDWIKAHLEPGGRFVLITPVLHPGQLYGERLKRISVELPALESMLTYRFSHVAQIHQELFEELGDERTFVLSL